jgi:DNA-binding MarR family transcriptional regulator
MDRVDAFTGLWRDQRPDLDVRPLDVWSRLKQVTALYDRALSEVLRRHGLSIAEFEVLATLRRTAAPHQLRPGELTRSLMVTAGAVTNRLDVLQRRGLVDRLRHTDDRRGLVVALTDKGLRVFEPALTELVGESGTLLPSLSDRQSSQLFDTLRKILVHFDDVERDAESDR